MPLIELRDNAPVAVSPRVVLREVEGEYIAVHTGRAKVFRLNRTAGKILRRIKEKGTVTVRELKKWLVDAYPSPSPEEIACSTIQFLSESLKHGLIEVKRSAE